MTSATSSDSDQSKTSITQQNKPTGEIRPRTSHALVLRADSPAIDIEKITDENKENNSFEMPLPKWRNRVDVYMDQKARTGYIATLHLNYCLGVWRNWQRRFGWDYQVLFVKGAKPM